MLQVVQQGGYGQIQLADESRDTDEDGEKGQDQEVGQLSGGAANLFAEIDFGDISHKTDRRKCKGALEFLFQGRLPPLCPN